ncbi:hypothetical protein QZN11_03275 [Streptomyces gramineus]|uniref:hypothetical protein n=1 Tax=Streptomyces gramineus TaxID=910542 RepID=UPI00398BAF5C
MRPHKPVLRGALPVLAPAAVAVAAWAAWLGWDQRYDVRPDGSVSGPYEGWQVGGLVLTLLIAVAWATARGHSAAAVAGTSAGLALAAFVDWSGDGDGLFMVGVALVAVAAFVCSAVVSAVTDTLRGDAPPVR